LEESLHRADPEKFSCRGEGVGVDVVCGCWAQVSPLLGCGVEGGDTARISAHPEASSVPGERGHPIIGEVLLEFGVGPPALLVVGDEASSVPIQSVFLCSKRAWTCK
jgi:hypothetical protein